MKFKIGDKVFIKGNLKIGQKYYNEDCSDGDTFSYGMVEYAGRQATVINIVNNGYILDIDPIHKYYDGMLEPVKHDFKFNVLVDELASKPYTFNYEVETVLHESLKRHYKIQMDKALEDRLFEKDPEAFQKLYDIYKIYV